MHKLAVRCHRNNGSTDDLFGMARYNYKSHLGEAEGGVFSCVLAADMDATAACLARKPSHMPQSVKNISFLLHLRALAPSFCQLCLQLHQGRLLFCDAMAFGMVEPMQAVHSFLFKHAMRRQKRYSR